MDTIRESGANRFTEVLDELGEGPIWDAAAEVLYWFDVTKRLLHRRTIEGEGADFALPKMPGALALRSNGGLLMVFRNGIGISDAWGADFTLLDQTTLDFSRERINDGAVDRRGRLWFGTFSPKMEPGGGALCRLDPDMSVHRIDTGISMSNGIAWSPDGKFLYFADSRPGQIYRYPFDVESGEAGPREVFLDYADRPGRPDGCTVDAEGFLWVAEVAADRVSRYSPDGRLDRSIELPVSHPTSLTFGGSRFDTLFVTSMHYRLGEDARQREPLAGAVFTMKPGVAGLPEHRFAA